MNHSLPLGQAEHEMLGHAHEILGNNLSEFLLSGLGEDQHSSQRAFTALSTSLICHQTTYRFEMINRSRQGLSTSRDPLVLAALLHQLWTQKNRSNEITIQVQRLLSKLQWPDSPKSYFIIQQAIERYFSTAYYLVDNYLPESERIDGPYSHCRRLLVAYDTSTDHDLEKSDLYSRFMIVRFVPDFLDNISSEKKYFLDLDFESLHSLQQTS